MWEATGYSKGTTLYNEYKNPVKLIDWQAAATKLLKQKPLLSRFHPHTNICWHLLYAMQRAEGHL